MKAASWAPPKVNKTLAKNKALTVRQLAMTAAVAASRKTVRANLQKLASRKGLSSRQQAVLRLASRWVQANAEVQLDLLVRLQVLEGAAGVSEGTFTRSLRSGLAAARKAFERDTLNPEWFSTGSTGAYMMLKNSVGFMYRASDIAFFDEDDAMQMAMSGLGAKTMAQGKIMSYEAGKGLASKIKKGRETPRSILGGKIYPWIRKRLISEVDLIKKHSDDESGEGKPSEHGVVQEQLEEQPGQGVIAPVVAKTRFDIVFQALGDSLDDLGQRIYDWAQAVFHKSGHNKAGSKYLLTWLELIREEGGTYRGIWQDVAERLGIDRHGLSTSKKDIQTKFIKTLLHQKDLMDDIDARVVRSEAMARVASSGFLVTLNLKKPLRTASGQQAAVGVKVRVAINPSSKLAKITPLATRDTFLVHTADLPDLVYRLDGKDSHWTKYLNL